MAEDDHGGPFAYWHQWIFRAFNLTFSFGGAFVFGLVINFLSDFINAKLDGMKEGKPNVIESGHTLILGWNDRLQDLVDQLCWANESEGGLPVVILADNFGGGKPDMDDWMNDAIEVADRKGTKIITRFGSRIENGPLKKCAVSQARSVIVLSDCSGDNDEDDAGVVRTTLALCQGLAPEDRPRCHFVIELMDVDNREVAMLGCGDGVDAEKKIKAVVSNEITGKLMIQSAREIPLSTCFGNLCCFDGSECYFAEWPEAVGTTFREVCYSSMAMALNRTPVLLCWVSVTPTNSAQPTASAQLSSTPQVTTRCSLVTRFWCSLRTTTPTHSAHPPRLHVPQSHHLSCLHHHQRTFCSLVGVRTSIT